MIFASVLFTAALQSTAAPCTHALLPSPALELVKPLMRLRDHEADDELTADGHWKKLSPLEPKVDEAFEHILRDRSAAGDQAVVYLLHVYLGESRGEELVCEATNRGNRLLPLIREYEVCTPTTGLEPYRKSVTVKASLSAFAIQQISAGGSCEMEQ